MLELPEAAHGLHLLQVAVEGQPTQTEAVATVTDGLQPFHLLHDGGHGYGRWHGRREELSILLRERLVTQSLLV